MGPSRGVASLPNRSMAPLLLLSLLLLGTCQLALGGYCRVNAVVAQLSGTPPNVRVPNTTNGIYSTTQYSNLVNLGWKVPKNRLPNGGSGGDFHSVFCNDLGPDCTSKTPPFTNCTSAYSGSKCLVAGVGTPPPLSTQGLGEVRIAYTCMKDNTVKFWVLMYMFNKNGVQAFFDRTDLWWVGFDDTIGKKLILEQNGSCTTEAGVPYGIKCRKVTLVYDRSLGAGKLFEIGLPATGASGLNIKVHGQWNGGAFAETSLRQTCFKPCPAVSNDPQFVGAHGTQYSFEGQPKKSFCLLTDADVHVNMRLDGYYDKRDFKDVGERDMSQENGLMRTWIREFVIMWRDNDEVHKFHLKARSGPSVEYGAGYLERMALDGSVSSSLKTGGSLDFPSLQFHFERLSDDLAHKLYVEEVYTLKIGDKLEASIVIRPADPLLRTADDAYVHLSMTLIKVETTSDVHGVLGQTYRDDRESRNIHFQKLFAKLHHLEADGETGRGFLDGKSTDYVTTDVFTPDCKYNRFDEGETVEAITSFQSLTSAWKWPWFN